MKSSPSNERPVDIDDWPTKILNNFNSGLELYALLVFLSSDLLPITFDGVAKCSQENPVFRQVKSIHTIVPHT